MTKRSLSAKEFEGINKIDKVSNNVQVCGIIQSLSPLKKSRSNVNYFEGELADNSGKIRLFGFDAPLHEQLQSFQDSKQPVAVNGCNVTQNKKNSSFELKLPKNTKLAQAKCNIDVAGDTNTKETIADIGSKPEFEKIIIDAKVLVTLDPVKVLPTHTKQDVIVADPTGGIKLTLWNNDINTLEDEVSYNLQNIQIRTFNNKQYLSSTRDGLKMSKIDDIKDIPTNFPNLDYGQIMKASIFGVNEINQLKGCVKCSRKFVISHEEDEYVTCSSCKTFQRMEHDAAFDMITELITKDEEQNVSHVLRATYYVLRSLLHGIPTNVNDIQHKLLESSFMTITYSDSYITTICKIH